MRLVINQNQVGHYNLTGSDLSLAFSLKFTDDDGTILKVTPEGYLPSIDYDGKTELAVFKMPSHSDDNPESWGETYKALFEERDFESLLTYHIEHNGWTTGFSYEAQRTMFVVLLDQYFDEIIDGINQADKKRRQSEIERLEQQLKVLKSIEDAPPIDKPDLKNVLLTELDKDIKKYRNWRDDYAKGNEQWLRYDRSLKEARAKKADLKRRLFGVVA